MPRLPKAWPWAGAALLLYGFSAATGPMWGDPSKLTLYALSGYLPSANPGDHAGWTALAWVWLRVFFWLEPVRALHLLSACAGAAAVALLHRLVAETTGEPRRAAGAATVALVAHPLWWGSAVAESYVPAVALALAGCVLARRSSRTAAAAAGLAAGLGVAAHFFSLVVSVPWLARRGVRTWLVLSGAVVGLSPAWLGLAGAPPDPLTGYRTGGGASWGWHVATFVDPGALVRGVGLLAGLLLLAFGPLGAWALVRSGGRRGVPQPPRFAAPVLALYALALCVYAPYRLPLMGLFLVLGLLLLRPPELAPLGQVAHVATQAALLCVLPWGASAAGFGDLGVRQLPERQNAWHFLCPVKRGEGGPERYVRELLAAAPPHSVLLADFNPGAVLRLVQRQAGLRSDVDIVATAIDDALAHPDPAAALAERLAAVSAAGRPAMVADAWPPYYRLEELEQRFGWVARPAGPGWMLSRP